MPKLAGTMHLLVAERILLVAERMLREVLKLVRMQLWRSRSGGACCRYWSIGHIAGVPGAMRSKLFSSSSWFTRNAKP